MIRLIPKEVQPDATCLAILYGAQPSRSVVWSVDSGTIEPFSTRTDDSGRCYAKVIPSGEPALTIRVSVSYGA